jgi:hypothetical protein
MSLSLYLLAVIVIFVLSREMLPLNMAMDARPGAAPVPENQRWLLSGLANENGPWQPARPGLAGAVVETP